jgi:hypothetical protein
MCPVCVPRRTARSCKTLVSHGQQDCWSEPTFHSIPVLSKHVEIRLLIRRLWVRVPPPELRNVVFRVMLDVPASPDP